MKAQGEWYNNSHGASESGQWFSNHADKLDWTWQSFEDNNAAEEGDQVRCLHQSRAQSVRVVRVMLP